MLLLLPPELTSARSRPTGSVTATPPKSHFIRSWYKFHYLSATDTSQSVVRLECTLEDPRGDRF